MNVDKEYLLQKKAGLENDLKRLEAMSVSVSGALQMVTLMLQDLEKPAAAPVPQPDAKS